MDDVRPTKVGRWDLEESGVFDLPTLETMSILSHELGSNSCSLDELVRLSDGVLDWDRGVSMVEVVGVGVVAPRLRRSRASRALRDRDRTS